MDTISTMLSVEHNPPSRIDDLSSGLTYVGYALPGADENDPVWLIRKVYLVGTVYHVAYPYASKLYNQVWTNRASLNYS
jgi:hypothetical protein